MFAKMGITLGADTSKLTAHASMKAFAEMYPEPSAAIWAEQKALADARKTAGTTPTAATTPGTPAASEAKATAGFKKYTVSKEQVGMPATFHQTVQLNAAGIRKFQDPSPLPTRGEVADKMNALQATDKPAYDAAMTKANETVQKWKHQPPSVKQSELANSLGIKVAPFTPASGNVVQKGSTMFSVGEGIHKAKIAEPEKYAEMKAALEMPATEAKAAQAGAGAQLSAPPATTTPAQPTGVTLNVDDIAARAKSEVATKTAATAAKGSDSMPTLTVPGAPAVQAESHQAE
jgi:hypothetical protein